MDIKKLILNYWKSIAVILCIFYLSFASPSAFKKIPTFPNEDKIFHLFMYLGLAAVLIFEYRHHKSNNIKTFTFVLLCIIFPILLGGAIELMQEIFFPPRSASWLDWLSDIAGVGMGWLAMQFVKPLKKQSF